MGSVDTAYGLELGFTPASRVSADPDRPPLLRAGRQAATPYEDDGVERHVCPAVDWLHDESVAPDLFTFGFDCVDLTTDHELQATLAGVLQAGLVSDDAAASIRSSLTNAVLQCTSGRRITVLYVAEEGLIMRVGGPGRSLLKGASSQGMNGHGPAVSVHSDQDVSGTPMRQLMDGRAPSLFRHDSPDGHNHDASLMLVNLWIPLNQITQPLVLADGRTVDRPRHQLMYGLPTDSFLDRDQDQKVNDIWAFLHDPDQRWYFRSEMDHRSAYVFDTLSTPHSSATLPGEDVAARCYLALQAAEAAAERGDASELAAAVAETHDIAVPETTTPALGRAIAEMISLLAEARADTPAVCGPQAETWCSRSRAARGRVVRSSVELRLVVSTAD